MFPHENESKSLLPKNAHGSPNFDKAACTIRNAPADQRKTVVMNYNDADGFLHDMTHIQHYIIQREF